MGKEKLGGMRKGGKEDGEKKGAEMEEGKRKNIEKEK